MTAAEGEEPVRLVAVGRRLDDSDGEGRAFAHPGEEFVHLVARDLARHAGASRVEHFPEFGVHDLASSACVLTRGVQRVGDGCRLVAVDREDRENVGPGQGGVFSDLGAHDREQGSTGDVFFDPRVFEQQLQVHVEDARRAVAALDVPADPEQALGDAAQHSDSGTAG